MHLFFSTGRYVSNKIEEKKVKNKTTKTAEFPKKGKKIHRGWKEPEHVLNLNVGIGSVGKIQ